MEIETRAHAKVNLHLEVLNRRPDGYHDIFSLMARVGLHDLLKLRCDLHGNSGGRAEITLHAAGGVFASVIGETPPERNLITRAARAYCARTALSGSLSVEIEKNIPAGAGLGGGSADAAAVLNALNGLYGLVPHDELLHMGAGLGADVPFCMTGGAAFCEGIGDKISGVRYTVHGSVLIAFDGTHVDTAAAYRRLSRTEIRDATHADLERLRMELSNLCSNGDIPALAELLGNDFELSVFEFYPSLRRIKLAMHEGGALYAAMTGSGSAVYGLFDSEARAAGVQAILRSQNMWTIITDFL